MRISDLLSAKGNHVLTISSEAPLTDAIEQMSVKRIVRAMHQRGHADTSGLCVADLMTRDVITCTESMEVTAVMEQMNSQYIRHIPVADGQQLKGLVSIRDIVSARVQEIEAEREQLEHYITGGGY